MATRSSNTLFSGLERGQVLVLRYQDSGSRIQEFF